MTRRWAALALPAGMIFAAPAVAQVEEGLIVQPAIPQDFSRGRNVSVLEQPRPDYNPLGVALGSMKLFPSVDIGAGATSNTYLTSTNHIASPFLYQQAAARLASGWSRHSLQITGSTTQREYLGQSKRNEDIWSLDATGRLEIYDTITVDANVNASRNFENLFSGEVTSNVAALSSYRRNFESLKTTYTSGRIRLFALLDHASFEFSSVPLLAGGEQDQRDRNRQITRLTGQFEYARTPSVALFAQISSSDTVFSRPLRTGFPNLDSKAIRFLGGANIDISGRVRGTIGIGYSIRNYDAGIYRTIRGLSVETRLEAFITPRVTIGFTGRRAIQDSTQGSFNPLWNTSFTVRGDYELLRNLILSASSSYSHLSYLNNDRKDNIYGPSVSARYLASRRVVVRGIVSYSRRELNSVSEARIETAIAYRL